MKSLQVLLVISSFLIFHKADAQTVSRSVTGSAGSTLTMGNQRITWTVGEPVTGIMTAGGHQLGNGFYQSLNLSVLLLKPEMDAESSVQVFPNPAGENITIRQSEQHPLYIRISAQNKTIMKESKIKSGDLINVREWKPGIYILNVTDNVSEKESVFKIVIL